MQVKKVEEVNYDLILRNLIPASAGEEGTEEMEDVKGPSEPQK